MYINKQIIISFSFICNKSDQTLKENFESLRLQRLKTLVIDIGIAVA